MEPAKPLRTIESHEKTSFFGLLGDLWRHRELIYLLAWRDYRVRYRQTAIGIAWAIFQPLVAMISFVFIFGRFKGIAAGSAVPYAIFVYSGLILWQFFSNTVTDSSMSLVRSGSMISKIYFPRIIVPVASAFTQCIDLAFAAIILAGLMIYYAYLPSFIGILYIVPILLILFVLSISVGILLSAVYVAYRDVQYALPFFIQIGLFVSPVIYSSTDFGSHQWLLYLNPMTGIIETFRAALFSSSFPLYSFGISCIITLLIFIVGIFYFKKVEGTFSDII